MHTIDQKLAPGKGHGRYKPRRFGRTWKVWDSERKCALSHRSFQSEEGAKLEIVAVLEREAKRAVEAEARRNAPPEPTSATHGVLSRTERGDCEEAARLLISAFSWDKAREGGEYWQTVQERLAGLAKGEDL